MSGGSGDLLALLPPAPPEAIALGPGAVLLKSFASARARALLAALEPVLAAAPWRQMEVPGGHRMSVAMSNCGRLGWVADRSGYRYAAFDPQTGAAWPRMPEPFRVLAVAAAEAGGFGGFAPDCCLINRYAPGARLSLHQDRDERDFSQPIVSVSLGLPARFLWGGLRRSDRPRRIRLEQGDVVVWGDVARLTFHGIEPLAEGEHPATGACRINLTFRKAA